MEQKIGKTNTKRSSGKRKVMFVLIGLGVVGIAGTAYYFYNRNKQGQSGSLNDFLTAEEQASLPLLPDFTQSNNSPQTQPSGKENGTGVFPIKKGSKGKLVKLIQMALIKKYGKEVLPKWGADGQWGQETTDALIANGYPIEIDRNTFAKFIGQGVAESLAINGLQDNDQLRTIRSTRVWNAQGQKLPIPKNTIIGEFVDAKNGVTTFQTVDNRTLFILTKDISYV